MTPNSFRQNKIELATLLGKVSRPFLRDEQTHPNKKKIAPTSIIPTKEEYLQVYNQIQNELAYDLLLFDESVFQFGQEIAPDGSQTLRYVFMQSFRKFVSFEDSSIYDTLLDESVEEYRELYYQSDECYVDNAFPFYIRYDYNEFTCRGRNHPCSHLHFVLPDSGRIALKIQMNPLTFAIFCVKMAYRDVWEQLISTEDTRRAIDASRNSCIRLTSKFWSDEESDLYIL